MLHTKILDSKKDKILISSAEKFIKDSEHEKETQLLQGKLSDFFLSFYLLLRILR